MNFDLISIFIYNKYYQYMKDKIELQRKFTRPYTISNYLRCSICYEVFIEPLKLSCGHTICKKCIPVPKLDEQLKCPMCRQKIEQRYTGADRVATDIINDLEVMCIDDDCPWRGPLSDMKRHYDEECVMKVIEKEKQDKQYKSNDDEVVEKLNENIPRGSLLARIIRKTDFYEEYLESLKGQKKI